MNVFSTHINVRNDTVEFKGRELFFKKKNIKIKAGAVLRRVTIYDRCWCGLLNRVMELLV